MAQPRKPPRIQDLSRQFMCYFKTLYWPPTPARLREMLSFLWDAPGVVLRVLWRVTQTLKEGNDIYTLLPELIRKEDMDEMRHPDFESSHTPEAARILSKAVAETERFLQERMIPQSYVVETRQWIEAILKAKEPERISKVIRGRVNDTLQGRYTARFTPIVVDAPSAALLARLQARDTVQALTTLEKSPADELVSHLLHDNETALVHTVVTDEGTFAIVTTREHAEIILCPDLNRSHVIHLLRAWLWLYYWHSAGIYSRTYDYIFEINKLPLEQRQEFQENASKLLYQLMLYNEHVISHFHPTEVPRHDGVPALPFPSWILMEVILRELGEGYLNPAAGLWHVLDQALATQGIRRIVLCSDRALAIFPHHATILNIAADGEKDFVLDRYEIVYLPQGTFVQVKPVKPQPPRLLVFGTDGEELSLVGVANLRALAPECVSEWHAGERDDASKRREKFIAEASQVNALTFLGHGKYDWDDASQSFLGLLKDRSGKGFNDWITPENFVEQIPPQLDLITLAGCETGLPQITTSASEYKGFAEYLLSRYGASAVVSTLWPVPQVSTVLLMRQFHKYWLLGDGEGREQPLPPVTALRKAQLWLRTLTREQVMVELEALASVQPSEVIAKEIQALGESFVEQPYAHPYFWSTFYVMGGVSWIH